VIFSLPSQTIIPIRKALGSSGGVPGGVGTGRPQNVNSLRLMQTLLTLQRAALHASFYLTQMSGIDPCLRVCELLANYHYLSD
jgi:hypothetical protein